MAIYRNGVRVKRLSTTTSCSSSDEELVTDRKASSRVWRVNRQPLAETKWKRPGMSLCEQPADKKRKVAIESADAEDCEPLVEEGDAGAEPCLVGNSSCSLPKELFDLKDLRLILSLDVWNHCLSEGDRESLCAYLPEMGEATFKKTLTELFAGQVFNFNSPMTDMLQRLQNGLCYPSIAQYQDSLRLLERKEHYHHLRKYHDGMVKSCIEMRNIWLRHGDADIKERLKLWHDSRPAAGNSNACVVLEETPAQQNIRLRLKKDFEKSAPVPHKQLLNCSYNECTNKSASLKSRPGSHEKSKSLQDLALGHEESQDEIYGEEEGDSQGMSETEDMEVGGAASNFFVPSSTQGQAIVKKGGMHVGRQYGFKKLTSIEAGEFTRAPVLARNKGSDQGKFEMPSASPNECSFHKEVSTSEATRVCFQEEEAARYSVSDIPFFYTNAIGKRCAVAPLKRMGAKLNSKARDHPILKLQRPSHVTILSLVRDAAARLPHSTGTRADVSLLVRDSQFVVADVSDAQLSQAVSGALDRLHYEKDPCVRFDVEKKLWVYLHAERGEGDFEENGTDSTKGRKAQKKDVDSSADQSYRDAKDTGDSDRDIGSPCVNGVRDWDYEVYSTMRVPEDERKRSKPLKSAPLVVDSHSGEDCAMPFIDLPPSIQPACVNIKSHPMGWEVYQQATS